MRALVIAALMLAVASASATTPTHEQLFADFKTRYNRQYESPHEEARRFAIFSVNMRRAAAQNKANPHASFGVNKFADKTEQEYKALNGLKLNPKRLERQQQLSASVTEVQPECAYVDWRLKGVVTPIKNQADCGGCWAFSTTGNIESQWALAGNPLVSLSEQELISCDNVDLGCGGGDMGEAMHYLLRNTNGTIATSAVYPFDSADGVSHSCNSDFKKFEVGASIIGFHNIASSESHMAHWLCHGGPLSIAVDANDVEFYTSGIMTVCSRNDVNHAILLVGMDLVYKVPYWIIKNSWGEDWGEDGYFRVEYGKNLCAITTEPMTAIVK